MSNPDPQRWPIPDAYRRQIVIRQIQDAINPASTASDANRAARILMSMDKQNLDEESKAKHLQNAELLQALADLADLRTDQLKNDDYIELQRLRALFEDTEPGPVRPPGQSRPVENGKAPGAH